MTRPIRPSPQWCNVRLECARGWDSLPAGEHEDMRHCDHCQKHVFKVTSERERDVASVFNRCVALAGFDGFVYMMGNPERLDEWAMLSKLQLSVSLATSLPPGRQELLARDFPVLFDNAEKAAALLDGQPVVLGAFERELVQDLVTELAAKAPELQAATARAVWHPPVDDD